MSETAMQWRANLAEIEAPAELRRVLESRFGRALSGDFAKLHDLLARATKDTITPAALDRLLSGVEVLEAGARIALRAEESPDDVSCMIGALWERLGPEFLDIARTWPGRPGRVARLIAALGQTGKNTNRGRGLAAGRKSPRSDIVNLNDIARLLEERSDRFDSLDVFVDDVEEFVSGASDRFLLVASEPRPRFLASVGKKRLMVELFEHGVARLRLTSQKAPAKISPATTALLGAATKEKGGLLGGLILGLLVGGLLEGPDRAMALRFEPSTQTWELYDGPLRGWAKKRLAAA